VLKSSEETMKMTWITYTQHRCFI